MQGRLYYNFLPVTLLHDFTQVLDKSITPAVYRLVCKHFGESEHAQNDATSTKAADEWIDCWVGCANVLVQNNYKVEGNVTDAHNAIHWCLLGLGVIHEARAAILGKDHRRLVAPSSWAAFQRHASSS